MKQPAHNKAAKLPEKRRFPVLAAAMLFAITFAAFYPSLNNGFVYYDDDEYVYTNADITSLSPASLHKIFTTSYVAMYSPVTMLSYAVEYHFGGLDPRVYHTTNLILHLLNCLLLFWLVFILSRNTVIAFITALLFGIHPLHVESVAWISERKDVLCAAFYLLSLIGYEYYKKDRLTKYYLISLSCFVLALLSKSMAVSLPLILLLIEWLQGRRLSFTPGKIFYFITALIFSVIAVITQHEKGINSAHIAYSVLISAYDILFYLVKVVFPVNLECFYQYPASLLTFRFLAAPAVVLALGWSFYRLFRNNRQAMFGALFFIIALLPVSQLIPIGGSLAADRYMYLPSIGLFYLCGLLFSYLYEERMNRSAVGRGLLVIAGAGVMLFLSSRARSQCYVWKDTLSLWGNVQAISPGMSQAYFQKADYFFFELQDHDKALEHYLKALQRAKGKDKSIIFLNRGLLYMSLRKYDNAMADYTEALVWEQNAVAYMNRGVVLQLTKDYEKALSDLNRAISINPRYADAYNNRGIVYAKMNQLDRAIEDFTCALKLNPGDPGALSNLGKATALRDGDNSTSKQ